MTKRLTLLVLGLLVVVGFPARSSLQAQTCAQPSEEGCPLDFNETVEGQLSEPNMSHIWRLRVSDEAGFQLVARLPARYRVYVYGPGQQLLGEVVNDTSDEVQLEVQASGPGAYFVILDSPVGDTSAMPYVLVAVRPAPVALVFTPTVPPTARPLPTVTLVPTATPAALAGCAAATGYTTIENITAGYYVDNSNWIAQSFRVPTPMELGAVRLYLSNQIPPADDSITVQIRTGGPGLSSPPGATVLASTMLGDPDPAYHFVTFAFAPGTILAANTPYYLVARGTGPNLKGYGWAADTFSPPYTDGISFSSFDGANWTIRPDADTLFDVFPRCV